ncbi:unnamed protein product, partial [Adineta steineri]
TRGVFGLTTLLGSVGPKSDNFQLRRSVAPSPLEDLEDEEDVDFSQATPSVHRTMKINRLITEDELPAWLKNDVDEVEKTLVSDEDMGKGRR